jgi:hypothetical protein
MTSKLIVNNIEADAGVSTITFGSEISASKITTSSTSAFSSGLNVTGGSVGIGTDNPATNLHISSTGTPTIQITDEDNSGIVKIENGSGSLFLNADTGNSVSNSRIGFYIDGSESLRITSTTTLLLGQITEAGVGGTPPDLNSTEVGRGYINLARDDTAAADHILFGKNGSIASSIGTDTTNTLVFKTGTTERLRITSDGDVVVRGPSNPQDYTLSNGIYVQPGNGNSGLTITSGSATDNAYINFSAGTASNAEQFAFAIGREGSTGKGLVKISDVNVAEFTSNGIAFPSGKGIDFSATSDASGSTSELLDDYEEGTWDPSVGGTATYNSPRVGYYVKIGQLVSCYFYFQINTIGTGNTFQISGLPYTSQPTISTQGAIGYFSDLSTNVYWVGMTGGASNTTLFLRCQRALDVSSDSSVSLLTSGSAIAGSITYRASS